MSSPFRALEPIFADDGVTAGPLCLLFANTVHDFGAAPLDDDLESYADLLGWAHRCGVVGEGTRRKLAAAAKRDPQAADAALARARKLRTALYGLLSVRARGSAPRATDLDDFNALVRSAMAPAELVPGEAGLSWRWPPGEGVADTLLWPIARSAAHLLTSPDADRIVECGGKTCTWLVLDTTKNHSRKYCTAEGCGNRTRVRRHYERERASRNRKTRAG